MTLAIDKEDYITRYKIYVEPRRKIRKFMALRIANAISELLTTTDLSTSSIVDFLGIPRTQLVAIKNKYIDVEDILKTAQDHRSKRFRTELREVARQGLLKSAGGHMKTVVRQKVERVENENGKEELKVISEERKDIYIAPNPLSLNTALFNTDPDNFQQNPEGDADKSVDIDPIEWVD